VDLLQYGIPRSKLEEGLGVKIEEKNNQGTGKLTEGKIGIEKMQKLMK